MLQYKTKIDVNQPYHIYYDVEMINNDQKNGEPAPKLVYNEARNMPYINCPENYFCSIVRFSLQTPSLPIFIPQVKLGQNDYNKTIYEIYMINTATNAHYNQSVQYIPTDTTLPSPAVPLVVQDLTSRYYFVYTVQHWVYMLNQTLQQMAVAGGIPAPFFYFDTNTSLLKFYMPLSNIPTYKIYVNKQLQTLLDSFQFKYVVTSQFGALYELQVYNDNYKNIETLNSVACCVSYQESTTISLLNPVKSIVFSTGLFPIQPSLTSPPQIFGADTTLFGSGNNANIQPIITDFEIALSNANTYKEMIEYVPSGEYRLIDMYGRSPLTSLELTVQWRDAFNNLHNFVLNSGCTCSVKIMFRRKDFNASDLNLN